jgi:hypothetical protein
MGVQAAIEAHAFGEHLDTAIGRLFEYAPPGFFRHGASQENGRRRGILRLADAQQGCTW